MKKDRETKSEQTRSPVIYSEDELISRIMLRNNTLC